MAKEGASQADQPLQSSRNLKNLPNGKEIGYFFVDFKISGDFVCQCTLNKNHQCCLECIQHL